MMSPVVFRLLCLGGAFFAVSAVSASGLLDSMPPETFAKAGLAKLSAEERAVLEDWLSSRLVEEREADRESVREAEWGFADASPERRRAAGAETATESSRQIRSRIDGPLRGWNGGTVFVLENGQIWRQTDSTVVSARLDNVEVIISRGLFGGYLLKPATLNSVVRVERIR